MESRSSVGAWTTSQHEIDFRAEQHIKEEKGRKEKESEAVIVHSVEAIQFAVQTPYSMQPDQPMNSDPMQISTHRLRSPSIHPVITFLRFTTLPFILIVGSTSFVVSVIAHHTSSFVLSFIHHIIMLKPSKSFASSSHLPISHFHRDTHSTHH